MKVQELINYLQQLPKDLECVSCTNKEEATYEYVTYPPEVGYMGENGFETVYDTNEEPNVVCIN